MCKTLKNVVFMFIHARFPIYWYTSNKSHSLTCQKTSLIFMSIVYGKGGLSGANPPFYIEGDSWRKNPRLNHLLIIHVIIVSLTIS